MQSHARAVVVGGGCVGAGILYGLAKRGWSDVVLLERTQLTAGSTWHAAGLIPSYARSHAVARLINRSIAIYSGLEAETGQHIGWHPCGQLRTASSTDRLDEYRSYMDVAAAQGANAHLITAEEVRELWPYLENPRILAGLYHPDDGHIAPAGVTMALVAGARACGAKVHQNTEVTGFSRRPSGEWEVRTSQGLITCEHVILATGNYARQTGAMLGLDIPAIPIVHQYWNTVPVPEIVARKAAGRPELPILRDEEFNGYIREEGDGLMFGPYERPEHLKLFAVDGVPDWFGADLLDEDFGAVEPQWEAAIQNVPMLGRAGIKANVRGPFQMTADELPLCGPAWGLENVWLAEGVPGGILWGGALGDALADWITTGTTPIDMSELDPRRFGTHCTKEWTRASVIETWGTHADLRFPFAQPQAARPGKTVPGHDLLQAAGAAWGVVNGWEVPMWFAPDGGPKTPARSFRHGPEQALIGAEVAAAQTGLALADRTPMAKFEVSGPGAADWLDRTLASPLPGEGEVGGALLLNGAGNVRAAFRIARIGAVFHLTAEATEQRRAFDELFRDLPPDGSVRLDDVTDAVGVLSLIGPGAAGALAQVTEAPLPGAGRLAVASCGLVPGVRILRGAGDLPAFELHHPMAFHRSLL
ncbi:MAG: FAD-dependent oxidoreductase, partial [Paracoccaceae bacterium]